MRTPASPPAAPEPGATDIHTGLSTQQVEARRQQYGPNEVLEKKPHPFLTFLSKFWGLSAWKLEAIAALSWTLHRYADLAIATALLILNATIAFVQERRAEGVVNALRRRLQVNARLGTRRAGEVVLFGGLIGTADRGQRRADLGGHQPALLG